MNNNKKYKKWSLGLVAPALVLAPIAVVASCSSSGEEKEAYGIEFKATQIRAKIHNAIQPDDLTNEQFKEEILNHLDELFSITGKLPTDDFISKNIEIGELQKDDDKKEVSAKVKVNNANTDGKSIEEIITLTGLGFDLTTLKYNISFKVTDDNQELELTGQGLVSVEEMNETKLVQLVLTTENKGQILVIDGENKNDITDEVLASQILRITEIQPNKKEGKITFKLSVEKPVNGVGETLEKTITFAGFKSETDSAPTEAYIIRFKAKESDNKYLLTTVSSKTTEEFPNVEDIKSLIIQEKSVIFEPTKGNLPSEESWWNTNLVITNRAADATAGEISVTIQLNNSDSSDSTQNIKETNVVLKGFQSKPAAPLDKVQTTPKATVTATDLGLNSDKVIVAKTKMTKDWIVQNIDKLVDGDHEVKNNQHITFIEITPNSQDSKKLTLKFKLASGSYYSSDNTIADAESDLFSFEIAEFTKAEKVTVKKAEFKASELGGEEFKSKNFDELNIAMNTFRWLFPNKEKYLQGDLTPETTEDNFIAKTPLPNENTVIVFKLSTTDSNKAIMKFPIHEGRTYDEQGIVKTDKTEITFTVIIGQ